MFRKSKSNLAMVAALALLVAAPVANADPARVLDPASAPVSVSTPDEAAIAGMRMNAAAEHYRVNSTLDAATIAGMRMDAAAKHYGVSAADYVVETPDYGVNTTDYSRADFGKPNPVTIAGLRMQAAAEHYAPVDLRAPDALDAAQAPEAPNAPVVETPDYGVNTTDYSRADFGKPNPVTIAGLRMQAAAEHYAPSVDLRAPDALDAAQAPVAPSSPVVALSSADEATLSPAGSDFPWAGLLVGLGLAGVAGLLGLVAARGSLPRPLGR